MASPVDYRKLATHKKGTYLTPEVSEAPDEELTKHFTELVSAAGGKPPAPQQVEVQMGRKLDVPLAGETNISSQLTNSAILLRW